LRACLENNLPESSLIPWEIPKNCFFSEKKVWWTGLDEDYRLNLSKFPICPEKRPLFLVMALNFLYARAISLSESIPYKQQLFSRSE
jgi:hypothetical protein